ncbi:zinc metalloprotease HtpX [Candidatus Woesearchaeota archaeon]|nr:zinc metalloprotease HtpX [Candidatus Woesearchaeota archaeon]
MQNQLKTVILLALLTGLLLGVGQLVGGMQGLTIAFIFAILMNFGSYWFSDKVVLAIYRAKQVTADQAPKLHGIVEEVSQQAGMPMPKVYEIPSENPNAFATGRNKDHAAIAVTHGLLRILEKDELKGVIAHEFAHIKNKDMLIQTVAATIAGVISYVAFMARWAAIFGGFGGRDRDSGNLISLLVLAIITPLLAMIIQLAISRSREYLADESGAKFIHNPYALADALEKIESASMHHPMRLGSQATSSLFIANPFRGGGILALLSTHPPIKDRVKKLREMRV